MAVGIQLSEMEGETLQIVAEEGEDLEILDGEPTSGASATKDNQEQSEESSYTQTFRSPIWKYFTYSPKLNYSRCDKCKNKLKDKFSTNLKNHLKLHKTVYEKYLEEVEKAEADLEEKELSKKKSGAKQKRSSNSEDHQGSIKKVSILSYVNLLIKYCAVSCVFLPIVHREIIPLIDGG